MHTAQYIYQEVSFQCLRFTLLIQFKLVYGPFGQSKMHSTLAFCQRQSKNETNVPLHKSTVPPNEIVPRRGPPLVDYEESDRKVNHRPIP